jgi:hypothetical protein
MKQSFVASTAAVALFVAPFAMLPLTEASAQTSPSECSNPPASGCAVPDYAECTYDDGEVSCPCSNGNGSPSTSLSSYGPIPENTQLAPGTLATAADDAEQACDARSNKPPLHTT